MSRPSNKRFAAAFSAVVLAMSGMGPAMAQAQHGTPAPPAAPEPKQKLPGDSFPGKGSEGGSTGTGQTLSDKLGKTDGVIRPPEDTVPGMNVPAPAPNPEAMPVIPPPGSPGNPAPVRPK